MVINFIIYLFEQSIPHLSQAAANAQGYLHIMQQNAMQPQKIKQNAMQPH